MTIGNPRADKLGRNGFECIVLRCSVDREREVSWQRLCIALSRITVDVCTILPPMRPFCVRLTLLHKQLSVSQDSTTTTGHVGDMQVC